MQHGLQSCDACGLISRPLPGAEEEALPARCDEELARFRKRASFQRTWAYLIAAAVCYIPANLLPVLTTTTATGTGVRYYFAGRGTALWSPTGWPLSLIVLVASTRVRAPRFWRWPTCSSPHAAEARSRTTISARAALPDWCGVHRPLVDG